ncbi:MAG TPA: ABC transporter permease [Pyrinomonadaceae bacterium]|jgi:lipopolysaccharide transport system permease protein|nr:ABC transporter permease [Pyrinomonadaceae bacterium]
MDLTTSEKARVLPASVATRTALDTDTDTPPAPHTPAAPQVPEMPLVTIAPAKSWSALDLRDLWAHRELLYFLMWRDIKVRYKQTLLGVAWVVLQPLLVTLIFTVFLGLLVRVPSEGTPYPLFVFLGLLPWTFFSSAVTGSGNSIVGNAHLITKVYFPRMIVPAASVGGRLVDFAVAFLILVAMMFAYGVGLTWNVLMLPVLVALTTLFALGCGLLISALNVRYRDIGIALPVLIQLWMYVSPVLYPSRLVTDKWSAARWIYSLNPLVGIIDGFRAAMLGGTFDWYAISVAAVITLVLLVYSAYLFRRVEKSFADLI